MIIVEGPDGAGKSTLVQRLALDLDIPIAKRAVGVDTKALVDLKQWTEDNLRKGFHDTLYDRHRLISEPIYGMAMQRTEPGFDSLDWMLAMMSDFYHIKPILIYCLPPKSVVIRNVWEGEADNSAVNSKIEYIYNGYVARAAIDCFNLGSCYIYDYTRQTYDGMLERVELKLEESGG